MRTIVRIMIINSSSPSSSSAKESKAKQSKAKQRRSKAKQSDASARVTCSPGAPVSHVTPGRACHMLPWGARVTWYPGQSKAKERKGEASKAHESKAEAKQIKL